MKQKLSQIPGPIGVFDSGYGGLTILSKIRETLPQYDYIYLGDNARTPYGTRSFEIVYEFTLQAVNKLFEMGCHLVILACNTASAKALRTIQMNDLPHLDPQRRVLGVIRPTVEAASPIAAMWEYWLQQVLSNRNPIQWRYISCFPTSMSVEKPARCGFR